MTQPTTEVSDLEAGTELRIVIDSWNDAVEGGERGVEIIEMTDRDHARIGGPYYIRDGTLSSPHRPDYALCADGHGVVGEIEELEVLD